MIVQKVQTIRGNEHGVAMQLVEEMLSWSRISLNLTCYCGEVLRTTGFVFKRKGMFYAECLSLNLISQGSTYEEALLRLREQVVRFVDYEWSHDYEHDGETECLFTYTAPFADWVFYYFYTAKTRLSQLLGISN